MGPPRRCGFSRHTFTREAPGGRNVLSVPRNRSQAVNTQRPRPRAATARQPSALSSQSSETGLLSGGGPGSRCQRPRKGGSHQVLGWASFPRSSGLRESTQAGPAVRKATVASLASQKERNCGKGRARGSRKGKGTEYLKAPPLPTCVKLQLVTRQRLKRELVTLEAGIQQRSLHS